MKSFYVAVAALIGFGSAQLLPSGMDPFCKFIRKSQKGFKYDISAAYRAADLVAVGKVTGATGDASKGNGLSLKFAITNLIKGEKQEGGIVLRGARCYGTACSGFSIARDVAMLILLKKEADGRFYKADGSGNDACPNVFEVKGALVNIGSSNVPIATVKTFLSAENTLIELR